MCQRITFQYSSNFFALWEITQLLVSKAYNANSTVRRANHKNENSISLFLTRIPKNLSPVPGYSLFSAKFVFVKKKIKSYTKI